MRCYLQEAGYAALFIFCALLALSSAQQHTSGLTSWKKSHSLQIADFIPMGMVATCSERNLEGCSASINMIEFTNGDEQHQYPYAGAMISIFLLVSIIVAVGFCSSSVS